MSKSGAERGFLGMAVFYGLATVLSGIFPCDPGCRISFVGSSFSQILHTLIGGLSYIMVPISLFAIGSGTKNRVRHLSLGCAAITTFFVIFLLGGLSGPYLGLYQRIIEGAILLWTVLLALHIKNL